MSTLLPTIAPKPTPIVITHSKKSEDANLLQGNSKMNQSSSATTTKSRCLYTVIIVVMILLGANVFIFFSRSNSIDKNSAVVLANTQDIYEKTKETLNVAEEIKNGIAELKKMMKENTKIPQEKVSSENEAKTLQNSEKNKKNPKSTKKPTKKEDPKPINPSTVKKPMQRRDSNKEKPFHNEPPLNNESFQKELTKQGILDNNLDSDPLQASKSYEIVIGITTIPRIKQGKHLDYLKQVVESYEKNINMLPEDLRSKILIFVQNNQFPTIPHIVFNELRTKYKGNPNFLFWDNGKRGIRFVDPFENIPGINYQSPNNIYPGPVARQQSCDVLSMSAYALKNLNYKYYMYTEDDFLACENSLSKIMEVLSDFDHQKTFGGKVCGLRTSYFFGGITLPKDVMTNYVEFAQDNIDRTPIDILLREFQLSNDLRIQNAYKGFCRKDGKIEFVYKTILNSHIGKTSTFEERNDNPDFAMRNAFPGCGVSAENVWGMPREELFDTSCSSSVPPISPCRL